ncbi:unnamed protein product [Ilex paraguariensis]|uniref:Succinate dehydrogenase assembly factor 4, mitochondrial n=1 Tax=Ilex paraguariensis TaxID=185542 RepID=A0ABC8S611_9AQUA
MIFWTDYLVDDQKELHHQVMNQQELHHQARKDSRSRREGGGICGVECAAGLPLWTEGEFSSSGGEQSGPSIPSAIELSKPPKLSLSFGRSEPSTSAIRLICSSTQRKQSHQENSKEPEGEVSENSEKVESEDDDARNSDAEDEDEDEDSDGVQVNKETGEIGGPRGPEPTRFGDWERNCGCSDF